MSTQATYTYNYTKVWWPPDYPFCRSQLAYISWIHYKMLSRWKLGKHPRSIQQRLPYPSCSRILPMLDLVPSAYLLESFRILVGVSGVAPRAVKAGCVSGSWKGQVFPGLTEWGQGRRALRFVYVPGGVERARLQLVLAENKCSHYLSWRDTLKCQSNNRSQQWGGFFICFFVTSLNFKPKFCRFT